MYIVFCAGSLIGCVDSESKIRRVIETDLAFHHVTTGDVADELEEPGGFLQGGSLDYTIVHIRHDEGEAENSFDRDWIVYSSGVRFSIEQRLGMVWDGGEL